MEHYETFAIFVIVFLYVMLAFLFCHCLCGFIQLCRGRDVLREQTSFAMEIGPEAASPIRMLSSSLEDNNSSTGWSKESRRVNQLNGCEYQKYDVFTVA